MTNPDEGGAFHTLGPEQVLDAIDALGLACDGRLLALNSFENRVYRIGIDDAEPIIAKFYRPGRWTDAQIDEEHAFASACVEAEIPVVAPSMIEGKTLHHVNDHRVAIFPSRGGRAPALDDPNVLEQLGRFIARIHLVGEVEPFQARPALNAQTFGRECLNALLEGQWLPMELERQYEETVNELCQIADERLDGCAIIRSHGDFHPGNVLWTETGPHIVDLDDARMAPAIQDLWMLASGEGEEQQQAIDALLRGYRQFRDFNHQERSAIEALRALRLIHYYAWIARRWNDPAFPSAFPWFDEGSCWQAHLGDLQRQLQAL
ncbi:serine/threonine protein kinase [Gammaproteobacteria bacterium]|nr:serine/threonine protein kinase [Gammaproteobacteria bacterium]